MQPRCSKSRHLTEEMARLTWRSARSDLQHTFTAGLNPYNGINKRGVGVRGRADTESCAFDVTPVTPRTADVLDTGSALIDDEVCWETGLLKERRESLWSNSDEHCGLPRCNNGITDLNVEQFIIARIALSNRIRGIGSIRVVVRDIFQSHKK